MKIAVTSSEANLDSQIDPRFGRCPYFLIVDTDTLEAQAVENANAALGSGAGIQSAQLVADQGVECVLTGNCGPNAFATLSSAGIRVITGCSGRARDAVEQFKSGALSQAQQANVSAHFGLQGGAGTGRGMGRGGGRGMGRGRGMGGGGRRMGGGAGRNA